MTKKQKIILWIGVGIAGVLLLTILLVGLIVPGIMRLYCKLEYRDWIDAYSRENDIRSKIC